MLYERWKTIAEEHTDQTAVFDPANQRNWTFGELAATAGQRTSSVDSVVSPSGHNVEFITKILIAWRDGVPVLPLEAGQSTPFVPEILPAIAHLKLTSGTTGKPRLVAFTAEQIAADATNIISTMGMHAGIPNLGVVSLAHSYGFSNLITPLLLHGIPLILCPTPLPEMVKNAASDHDAITLPAVPAMWRAWHVADSIPSNVTIAISAGAPLPLELEKAVFEKSNLKIHNFCGSSECGGIAFDRSTTPRTDPSTIGCAMDRVSLSISDKGCLIVSSEAVGEGYVPVENDCLGNGRFVTSDLAEIRDSELHILGRVSDVINVAGRKLSPGTVEEVVRRHSDVQDCVVFGIPSEDDSRCEEVAIAIQLKPEATVSAAREESAKSLAAWQVPRHWWVVNEINTNSRGKISRKTWREEFLAQRFAKANQSANPTN